MNLLIISLAPVFIIGLYIYFRDKYEKEPLRLLFFALLAGALTVIPVFFVEQFLDGLGKVFPQTVAIAWKAFIVAGFTEEFFKYAALYLLIWKNPEFNEKFDGIVYAVFVSLGFAGVENIMYVLQGGFSIGISRAITAVPAHAIFGVTMGFYFGMAKFFEKERSQLKRKALFYPVLLHGVYDFILFTGIEWLTIVFFAFLGFLYFSAFRRLKKLSDQSIYRTDFDLLNDKFSKPM